MLTTVTQRGNESPRGTTVEGSPIVSHNEGMVCHEAWGCLRRAEMPIFEGGNFEVWIFRARKFFSVHRLFEAERLDVAAISFEGEAISWFQWDDRRRKVSGWDELKSRLLDRFGLSYEGSLCERFLAMGQEGSVREFRQAFLVLASALPGLLEHVLEGVFINGLRPEI